MIIEKCKTCGISYETFNSKGNHKTFCSKKCRRHTEETKNLMSKNLTGIPKSNSFKMKMSKMMMGHTRGFKKGMRGELCVNWKGGLTDESKIIRNSFEYKEWRESVFKRDNYTCQECGQKGVYLQAHHIKSFCDFPELRLELDNGISLCKECHKKTSSYGFNRFNSLNVITLT